MYFFGEQKSYDFKLFGASKNCRNKYIIKYIEKYINKLRFIKL